MSYALMHYDSDADDRRGESSVEGYYRSQEKAQEVADRNNASYIERHNTKCRYYWAAKQRRFEAEMARYNSARSLYDLGLSNDEPVVPTRHVSFVEWRQYTEWTTLPVPVTYYPEEYRAAEPPIIDSRNARHALGGGYLQPVPTIPWDDHRLVLMPYQPDHYFVTELDYEDDE